MPSKSVTLPRPRPILPILDKKRVITLYGAIDETKANETCKKIMEMSYRSKATIKLYISSEGGFLLDALSIIEAIKMSPAPVKTIGLGYCLSAAALILAAGYPGYRALGANSWVLLHELSAGLSEDKLHDLKMSFDWLARIEEQSTRMLADFTGQDYSYLKKIMEKDFTLSAEEALEFGLVDMIINYERKKK
jgi:ATP-dependent Clp protease protease subunit